MCFQYLPIEFDASGRARLKDDVRDPYGYQVTDLGANEDRLKELLARNGFIRSVDYDPVTRVAGALAFHSVVDLENRTVLSANSMATIFRGYEVILKGRDPRDAIFISSRACGVCGGVHATVSAEALEMAFDIRPPRLGILLRNLLLGLEYLYDHPLHLFLLAGPDYSESLIRATNPSLWDKARKTLAPRAEHHGYGTMAELLTDMNPLTGSLYLEALHMTRVAREAYVVIGGKYPHPETVVPGGISATVSLQMMNEVYQRLQQFFDYSKKVVAIWEDITQFFYEADPKYQQCGTRPANLIDTGVWDDPETYDASYKNIETWGNRRWSVPGVIIGGKQVTTSLQNINIGLEEFIERSYYHDAAGNRFPTDPLGAPLSPNHPWNRETKPRPGPQNWKDRYSWSTTPRWDRQSCEAGAYARVWNAAAANKLPYRRFIEPTGQSLKILVPEGKRPEQVLEWHIPQVWNAFERNLARAYCIPFSAMAAMDNWLMAMECLKQGDTDVATPFEIPRKGTHIGAGFWGAGRGFLTHHIVADNGAITNYQILTPSTINAAPRDPWGHPSPYEESVMKTPILEEFDKPDNYTGIDLLRAIRSFDPCMPCTTHIMVDKHDLVITREVNTCGCGV
ncbi:nickel-dependent hydrogenase large subunit [uncultured Meiothermus sp.]|jgi:hydrogenase large subunit|uniref:nickel-dependent hydrogenase large subunit n=1 Tax=uncultured Meiothermus sp. TaxID=157471 RepID=UPI002628DE74|nr:nickel-dependent hydrogenase large subunit [uncultured Meiothermus sp.]